LDNKKLTVLNHAIRVVFFIPEPDGFIFVVEKRI